MTLDMRKFVIFTKKPIFPYSMTFYTYLFVEKKKNKKNRVQFEEGR